MLLACKYKEYKFDQADFLQATFFNQNMIFIQLYPHFAISLPMLNFLTSYQHFGTTLSTTRSGRAKFEKHFNSIFLTTTCVTSRYALYFFMLYARHQKFFGDAFYVNQTLQDLCLSLYLSPDGFVVQLACLPKLSQPAVLDQAVKAQLQSILLMIPNINTVYCR